MVRIGIGRSGTNRRSNGEAVPRIILRNASNCGLLAITIFAALSFAIFFHAGVFVADIIPSRHASDDSDVDVLIDDLISWLKSNGAVIDDRISIRRVDPADPTSIRGIFADRGSFEKGEKLFSIPLELIYDNKPRTVKQNVGKRWKDDHYDCGTTYEIHDAMLSGATPYGRYLAAQPRRYVPGYWSPSGRELLGTILGENLAPRFSVKDRAKYDWIDGCKGATEDELEVHASMLVTARADGKKMIPLYDMINHRNGGWYNAQHYYTKNLFSLVTNRRIERGEQFYLSYNTCTICGSRIHKWGTIEMFRDYGFVEPFPQRYLFDSVRLKFGLDETKDGHYYENLNSNGEGSHSDGLVVKWYVPPSQKGLDFLTAELDRLQNVGTMKDNGNQNILESEWNSIWMLHGAMAVAFQAALDQAPAASGEVWKMGGGRMVQRSVRSWTTK